MATDLSWTPRLTASMATPRHTILWHLLFGLLGGSIGWHCLGGSFDDDAALQVLSWVLVSYFVWTFASWRATTGAFLTPYSAFALAAYLFNGGLAIVWAIGFEGGLALRSQIAPDSVRDALALTLASLWSLHLGALVTVRVQSRRRNTSTFPNTQFADAVLRAGLLVTAVASLPALLGLVEVVTLALSSGYVALYQRDLGTGWSSFATVIANLLVPGIFSILAGAAGRKRLTTPIAAVILLWTAALLFVGYRGTAVAMSVAFLWLWSRRVHPIRGPSLALGIAALLLVIPLVNASRGLTGAERLNPEVYVDIATSLEAPVVAALSEMGGTLGVTAETMELIPATRSFDLGRSYLYALFAVVPNVAWDKHPSSARGTPSEWFIWTVDPRTASTGGSRGFSFIAEGYFNFGYLAPVVTLVFGIFLGLLERWIDTAPTELKDAFIASYLLFFLPSARNDAMMIFRPFIWYAGVPYAAAIVLASAKARRSHRIEGLRRAPLARSAGARHRID